MSGYAAFNCCSGIVDLNLSNCTSLQYIHNNAFSGCNGLKTIDLSHCTELREIQSGVFMSCSALNTVNLEYCSLDEISAFISLVIFSN